MQGHIILSCVVMAHLNNTLPRESTPPSMEEPACYKLKLSISDQRCRRKDAWLLFRTPDSYLWAFKSQYLGIDLGVQTIGVDCI